MVGDPGVCFPGTGRGQAASPFGAGVYRFTHGNPHHLQKCDQHTASIKKEKALAVELLRCNNAPIVAENYTNACSMPCNRMSLGRSMPINTSLLFLTSSGAQAGPRSLPMSWCTPWKITLRSLPCI